MTNNDLLEKIGQHEILLKEYFSNKIDSKKFDNEMLKIFDSLIEGIEIVEKRITSSAFIRTNFKNTKFQKSEAYDIMMFEDSFESVVFNDNDFFGSDFRDCIFLKTVFINCNLEKSEFYSCKFIDCELNEVDLSYSFFTNCSFENSKLEKIDIEGAHFSETNLNIKMCKLINIGEISPPAFANFDISEKGDKSILINSINELKKYLS